MTFSASLAISSPFHPIPSPPQIISLFLSLLFIICGLPLAFCDFNLVCQIFYGFFLHLTIYYFNLADLHLSINRYGCYLVSFVFWLWHDCLLFFLPYACHYLCSALYTGEEQLCQNLGSIDFFYLQMLVY